MMSDSDDDVPTLSAHTLAALQEFYTENLALQSPSTEPEEQFSVGAIEEDWGLSQFWYSEDTARRLAEELVREAGDGGRIACVSAPSVYQKLKQGVVPGSEHVSVMVLEYDRRFASYGDDFIFYDYNQPLALPPHIQPHSFDAVLADPPYLSHECLGKVAQTVRFLSKGKVLLCTGAVMQSSAKELLEVNICGFLPQHQRNLSNDFRCYTNYPSALRDKETGQRDTGLTQM
uniref:EEF1A lysine methyltransferase 1 n=1 Tax=Neogobius melanostomus TaxID=47308 RepID=A0A8C6UMH5_9GOBI